MAIKTIRLVQGEEQDLYIPVVDKFSGNPVCLETFEGATAFFPSIIEGESVGVTGSVFDADAGVVKFNVTETDSASIMAGDEQDWEFIVDRGAGRRIITQVYAKLFVTERLF